MARIQSGGVVVRTRNPRTGFPEITRERLLTVAAVVTLVVALGLPVVLWVLVIVGVLPPSFCAI